MKTFREHPLVCGGAVLVVALAVASGLAAVSPASGDARSTYSYLRLFSEVLALIGHNYVETVPQDELLRGAYEGLLASLDGESEYLSAADQRAMGRLEGENEGRAGIFLTRRDGVLFVASVLPGSDAKEKGIRLGDQVRRIDAKPGRELSLSDAERLLRGPLGGKVKVAVSRREEPRREEIEVAFRKLSLPTPRLAAAQEGVAVVEIPAFGEGSAATIAGILADLRARKVERALLDLRGNAWGEPQEAAEAASLFAGQGVMAQLRMRNGEERPVRGEGPRSAWRGEVLMLTDAGTAYAAEIFVAALLDTGVARHGGERTLGRGGERDLLPLANGDFLYLTVRKYTSPAGTTWHGEGLTPGVSIPSDRSMPFEERKAAQLQKAVEWLRNLQEEAKAA